MLINPVTKKSNCEIFFKKLETLRSDNFNPSVIQEKYSEILENASFSLTNEIDCGTEGTLIEIILKVLTPYAVKINNLLPENLQVDKNTLVKVCLLHQISKAIRYVPNDNEWEIKNRQMTFKYNPDVPIAVGTGLHSVILLNELGISLTPEEVEAMTIIDRDIADKQAKYYCTTLSAIVRQANEMTYLQLTKSFKK